MAQQLYEFLLTLDTRELLDTDERWRLFIYDYKELIKQNSPKQYISNETLVLCDRDIQRLLRTQMTDVNIHWIFYVINDISSEYTMTLSKTESGVYYYMPDINYIQELRNLFINSVTVYNKTIQS